MSAELPANTPTILAKTQPDSPEAMAARALGLLAGPDRDAAFTDAVNRWILSDPSAVAAWSLRLTTPREFDQVAALLVIHTDTLHRPTSLALEWAEDLADPVLRRRALIHVLREWAQADHDAALHYAESSPSLTSEQRAAVLAALTPYTTET